MLFLCCLACWFSVRCSWEENSSTFAILCALRRRLNSALTVALLCLCSWFKPQVSGLSSSCASIFSRVVVGDNGSEREGRDVSPVLGKGIGQSPITRVLSSSLPSCEVLKEGPLIGGCKSCDVGDDLVLSAPIALAGWRVVDEDWHIIAVSNDGCNSFSGGDLVIANGSFSSYLDMSLSEAESSHSVELSLLSLGPLKIFSRSGWDTSWSSGDKLPTVDIRPFFFLMNRSGWYVLLAGVISSAGQGCSRWE